MKNVTATDVLPSSGFSSAENKIAKMIFNICCLLPLSHSLLHTKTKPDFYIGNPNYLCNTMIASVSFVLTGNLICNFPQTGEISNSPLTNMHEQTSNSQNNSKQC